jgi:2-phospho-L-lactate guanylyltransferase
MSLWAIVPIKPLLQGKSRLSGVLSALERNELNIFLLEHTLSVLKGVAEIAEVLVVSRDPEVLRRAREANAVALPEEEVSDLNQALRQATLFVQAQHGQSVLVIPADLPLLCQADLQAILQCAGNAPGVVIVPDRRREGTNALLVQPAGQIDYAFGAGSFGLHCSAARQAGVPVEICDLPLVALDLDLPEDLEAFRQMNAKTD